MITENQAYFLGLMYSKGNILIDKDNKIKFRINIKFRRPNDEALRNDNKYTAKRLHKGGKEKLVSRFSDDCFKIKKMLTDELGLCFDVLHGSTDEYNWGKKTISITSESVSDTNELFTFLFQTNKLDSTTLRSFPFSHNMEKSKPVALAFIQGVCDACSLVANEASSQNGGNGKPRIQLEPDQERWELCIGLCKMFQEGLGIRVNNINWGHPQIRTSWRGQNHQFRVNLSDIPQNIEIYRLKYKREEYLELYKRRNVTYNPNLNLCPLKKKTVKQDMCIDLSSSDSEELNNTLLDERIRGISVDKKSIKSILVCYLLGCKRCNEYINVSVDGKII